MYLYNHVLLDESLAWQTESTAEVLKSKFANNEYSVVEEWMVNVPVTYPFQLVGSAIHLNEYLFDLILKPVPNDGPSHNSIQAFN